MKNKKDLLLICQFFYPEYISSALLPYQTVQELIKKGITVDVICGKPKEYIKENMKKEDMGNLKIFRVKYLQLGRKGFIARLINYFSFTISVFTKFFSFRNYKAIMIYSNPPILPVIAIFAKKIFGCKIIFVSYDVYPEIAIRTNALGKQSIIAKAMRMLNKSLYKNVSRIVALSHDMKTFLMNNRDIDGKKISVISNWATEKELTVNEIENDLFREIRKKSSLIISYLGNMGTAQDIETIISVAKHKDIREKDIFFLFAGHGNKKESLRNIITQNNLNNVYLFKYLSGNEFEEVLYISDLFVVSLAKNISGLAVPSKTYSYYQAGKPVIAVMSKETDIAKELIANNSGLAIKNGETEKMIEEILNIYNKKKNLNEMRSNMENMYNSKYRKEYPLQKYVDLVKEVIKE